MFGSEASPAVQYVIAFAIIFVLLTAFALVLRRLTASRLAPAAPAAPDGNNRSRQPRLGIVDIYELDKQRRLILLRRDQSEHLLLIGGPNDVVVETNIPRAQGQAARGPAAANEGQPERFDPAFDRAPESVRPVIEPARAGVAPFSRPDPAEFWGERPAPVEVPILAVEPVGTETAPASEPARRPQRGLTGGGRMLGGSGQVPIPPAAPPPPETPVRVSPPTRPEMPRMRPEPPARPARVNDPAVLSDMAKQLEDALRRPRAPVSPGTIAHPAAPAALAPLDEAAPPASAPPTPPAPAPRPERAPPATFAPVLAATTAAAPVKPAEPEPAAPTPEPHPEPIHAAAPAPPALEAEPAPPAPPPPPVEAVPPPPPAPAPAQPASAPVVPEAPAAAPAAPAAVRDPFSVEEIEAEFARLLGRPFEKADRG